MKIQISPTRIVADVPTVWNEAGPEVDFVFKDIKDIGMRAGSVDEIYVFHVFEHLFDGEIIPAIRNWIPMMAKGGRMFFIVDDWEFICRAFLSGEFDIKVFNKNFSYPTKITRDSVIEYLESAGFSQHDMSFWYLDVPNLFPKKEYEIIVSAKIV